MTTLQNKVRAFEAAQFKPYSLIHPSIHALLKGYYCNTLPLIGKLNQTEGNWFQTNYILALTLYTERNK